MRDRRARLGMVLLVLSFPYLIGALSTDRQIPVEATSPTPLLSTAALVRLWPDLGVELTEVVVLAGLFYAGWQRRRLLNRNPH
ncbi:MAG: hypothetical protein ABI353_05870 [Isosphaeraceae bacterium]